MREIKGIKFADSVADDVQTVIDRIEAKIGKDHLFGSRKHLGLKFAERLPDESKGKHAKAYRLFLVISPRTNGAVAKRPRPPKTGWKEMPLNSTTVDEVVRAGLSWFYQVQKMKIPDEYQDTENPLVFAGGRYESKRSKF